ncbi:MAG: LPS export ABC transporter permease LptG [Paracoccus sp. (in: a-proteobacteria)]|uniref:LPS export ABC transporter permease LptG n=1 Tax=Paracoccus sp. TaxID=267 RepID=UPI0026E038E3|nr:LPS export ABC transporter permease LptG [Paracoccus sp. (in: a-proteobacteria)]MDO5621445.1 LPS export ABC transporter permease LptG [Paracoccus sp. (in: a-proteobacteria)]
MILPGYIARRFLRMFLIVSGAFIAILFLLDLVEQIRRFSGQGIGLAEAAGLSALNIAGAFYAIMPLVTVLAAIALFIGLARSSELVAIRASGRSALRFLVAPTVTAFLIGLAAVAVLNPFVAASSKRYDEAITRVRAEGAQTISVGQGAVWLRQSLPPETSDDGRDQTSGGQVVIRADRASPDATTLYDATFIVFSAEQGPLRRLEARQAVLQRGSWVLTDVKQWLLAAENPEVEAALHTEITLPSDLTADRIRDSFGQPDAVPIWQLPSFIRGLEQAGFSAQRHQVWFQMELARPFLMAAMVLVAAVFTLRHLRGRNVGIPVLLAFGCGIAVFFLRNMAQVLGDNGQVTAIMAAWTPPLVAALAALAAILQQEDG